MESLVFWIDRINEGVLVPIERFSSIWRKGARPRADIYLKSLYMHDIPLCDKESWLLYGSGGPARNGPC